MSMNHKEKVNTGILALQAAFPKLFNRDQPKPLAIGTTLQLAKLRRAGVLTIPLAIQRAAMNSWLASPNYHRALASTPFRYNLDGSVYGPVSDDHRQRAIDKLKAFRKAKKARKAAVYQSKMKVEA
jgi:ProP effector